MRRIFMALTGLSLGVMLLGGAAVSASAQEAVRTFMFEPAYATTMPMTGTGSITRQSRAIEALEDSRLLRASGAVATQEVEPVYEAQPTITWFRFRSLTPDSVHTVVSLGTRPEDPAAAEMVCQFRTDGAGRGECSGYWFAAMEPTAVQVRRGGVDGSPVMRGF